MFVFVLLLCLLRPLVLCPDAALAPKQTHQGTSDSSPRTPQYPIQIYSPLDGNFLSPQSTRHSSQRRQADYSENHCTLHIPESTHTYNIIAMHDLIMHVNKKINDYVRINLCQPLDHKCARQSGYAVCFHKANGEELGVGKHPPELSLEAGNIVFSYEGDRCNATHMFTVRFELECGPSEQHSFYIENDDYMPNSCEFHIVFKSASACVQQEYSCELQHQTHSYSLERLKNIEDNYVVNINGTLSVILNVCRNLAFWDHYANLMCGLKSAICLIDQTDYYYTKYINLGNIESWAGMKYAGDGIIRIEYENGEVCDSDKTKLLRSTISFICDMDAKEGHPEYAGGLETCDLLFAWRTAAACSEEELVNSSLNTAQPCRVTDPITGHTYDFSQLHEDNVHYTVNINHLDYQFSVCKEVDSECKKGTGVCKTSVKDSDLTVSGGNANSRLLWSPRMGLYLNYTGGDKCADNQYRHSIVNLTCAHTYPHSVDITEKECSTTIKFQTGLGCPTACSQYRHTEFESLMNTTIGYKIKRSDAVYSFNVCMLIDPWDYYNCGYGGAGICKLTNTDVGKPHETSLGYPEPIPKITIEGITTLKYVNGSACGKHGRQNISSQISLICDITVEKSFPEFHSYDKCVYEFVWRSRRSCGIVDCRMNSDCSVQNELGHRWDLTALRETFIHQVPSLKRKRRSYYIHICGDNNAVAESYIYTKETDAVRLKKVTSDYGKNITLTMYFSHRSTCANGAYPRSVMYIICDETPGPAEPVLLWEEECSAAFEWRTRLVCSPEIKVTSRSRGISWTAIIITIILLALLFTAMSVVIYFKRNNTGPHYRNILTDQVRNTWDWAVTYRRGAEDDVMS